MTVHNNVAEPWKVTLVDTGLDTMTGGRIKRVQRYIGDEPFMMTYGDGVSDINMNELLAFHKAHGKTATITAVSLEQRFGVLDIAEDDSVISFREKRKADSNRINVGYMVLEPEIFNYIEGDATVLKKILWNGLRQSVRLQLINMMVSGSVWIQSVRWIS